MTKVAVATTSQLAADAAAEIAASGGNAVDCALAASLLTMNTEPGVCALAGSAFITIWAPGKDPVTIDGNVTVPGSGLPEASRGKGAYAVNMDYGSGIETLVGPGSVSVPGSLAALEDAWAKYGRASWSEIFAPTIRATRVGFPLPSACHYYLQYSGDCIFGRSADGHAALHDEHGLLRAPGSEIVVPHLADTLAQIAEEGARSFYAGDLARKMVAHVHDGGGMLTLEDLKNYHAIERSCLSVRIGPWTIATNPPPAVGGAVLAAMLLACAELPAKNWSSESLALLIRAQRAALGYRKRNLDLADDVGLEAKKFLELARDGELVSRWASASTVHTSAVDDEGFGCAITASSGYGSGEMPADTGLWLNNCLGELELNRRGLQVGPTGARLPSNMAPSVARCGGKVMAIGSPGADRITTALHQFLVNNLQMDMPLAQAVSHPRVHIDTGGKVDRLMAEAGLDLPQLNIPVQTYPELNMYFGGVGAASYDSQSGFDVAADPRREGGIHVCRG
jgi:gamma-glutamyltranspeptidase/glutathione hydrolase